MRIRFVFEAQTSFHSFSQMDGEYSLYPLMCSSHLIDFKCYDNVNFLTFAELFLGTPLLIYHY